MQKKHYRSSLAVLLLAALIFASCAETQDSGRIVMDVYPQLSDSPIGEGILTSLPRDVVLRSEDIIILQSEIDDYLEELSPSMQTQLENNKVFILEQLFTEQIMLTEAITKLEEEGTNIDGKADMEILQTFFGNLVTDVEVDDREVEVFYEEHKELLNGMPFEEAEDQIKGLLIQMQQQEMVEDYVMDTIAGKQMEVQESWFHRQAEKALDNELDQARVSGQPTFVAFKSEGCVTCEEMEPIYEQVGNIYSNRVNIIEVQAEENQFLASRYGVQSVPTHIFYDDQGIEFYRETGSMEREDIEELLADLTE